jgi:polyribonucleotide nucleotidyltransferase
VPRKEIAADFYREIEGKVFDPLAKAMRIHDKLENYESVETALKELVAAIPETEAERRADAKAIFKELKEKVLREEVLTHGVRLDGRKFDEIRPIWIETGVLPRTHGSAIFTRGETQALVTCTLGTDDAEIGRSKARRGRLHAHYASRPSVGAEAGEGGPRAPRVGPVRSPSARWRRCTGGRSVSLHGPRRLGPSAERLTTMAPSA